MKKISLIFSITLISIFINGCSSKYEPKHISSVKHIEQKKIIGVENKLITLEYKEEKYNDMRIGDIIRENKKLKKQKRWIEPNTYIVESYSYSNCSKSIENIYFDIKDDTLILGYDLIGYCDEEADCRCSNKLIFKISNLPKKKYKIKWKIRNLCR